MIRFLNFSLLLLVFLAFGFLPNVSWGSVVYVRMARPIVSWYGFTKSENGPLPDLSRVDNSGILKALQEADKKLLERLNQLNLPARLKPLNSHQPALLTFQSKWSLKWLGKYQKIKVVQDRAEFLSRNADAPIGLETFGQSFLAGTLRNTGDVANALRYLPKASFHRSFSKSKVERLKKELLFVLPVSTAYAEPEPQSQLSLSPYRVRVFFDKVPHDIDPANIADRFAALFNAGIVAGDPFGTVVFKFKSQNESWVTLESLYVEVPVKDRTYIYHFPRILDELRGNFPLGSHDICHNEECLQSAFDEAFNILNQDWADLFTLPNTRFAGKEGLRFVRSENHQPPSQKLLPSQKTTFKKAEKVFSMPTAIEHSPVAAQHHKIVTTAPQTENEIATVEVKPVPAKSSLKGNAPKVDFSSFDGLILQIENNVSDQLPDARGLYVGKHYFPTGDKMTFLTGKNKKKCLLNINSHSLQTIESPLVISASAVEETGLISFEISDFYLEYLRHFFKKHNFVGIVPGLGG